jgi:uncharacterized lipoprotein YbaY
MDLETLIKGEVKFEDHAVSFSNATMHVYLENVSAADASSEVVGYYERKNVSYPDNKSKTLSFEITGKELNERESYTIRVHIDIKSSGRVSKGDFISMQSYPVATFGHPRLISVLVKQVT